MYLNFAEGVHIDDLSGHVRTGVVLSPSAFAQDNPLEESRPS